MFPSPILCNHTYFSKGCVSLGSTPASAAPVLSTRSCRHTPDQSRSSALGAEHPSKGEGWELVKGWEKALFPFSWGIHPSGVNQGIPVGMWVLHDGSHRVVPAAPGYSDAVTCKDQGGVIPTWSCWGSSYTPHFQRGPHPPALQGLHLARGQQACEARSITQMRCSTQRRCDPGPWEKRNVLPLLQQPVP